MIDTTTTPPAHRLCPDVFLAIQDGVARLLDFDRGRFYGLDALATRMLLGVLEHGAEPTVARVAREYDVPAQTVRTDLAGLLLDLQRRHLLTTGPVAPRRPGRFALFRPAVRPPGPAGHTVPAVRRLLRRCWLCLRLFGWTRTLAAWRCRSVLAPPPEPEARQAIVEQVDRAVREAAACSLLPLACKERALAGFHLLRNVHGLPAELVVGIQHYPFGAHAWVEVEGQVVTDDPGHCEAFVPVARYA